jgi:hypothetical protein
MATGHVNRRVEVSCKPLLTFASRCEDATVSYAIQGALYYRVRASTRKLARQHRQSERQTFEGQMSNNYWNLQPALTHHRPSMP